VDIVRGSSPRSIAVDLPAGKFGRPALTVTEGWAVKGVAFRFLRAVATQDLALFALVLVAAMVLVTETAFASANRRRAEFGVLRAMGWSGASIGALLSEAFAIPALATGPGGRRAKTVSSSLALLSHEWRAAQRRPAWPMASLRTGSPSNSIKTLANAP